MIIASGCPWCRAKLVVKSTKKKQFCNCVHYIKNLYEDNAHFIIHETGIYYYDLELSISTIYKDSYKNTELFAISYRFIENGCPSTY